MTGGASAPGSATTPPTTIGGIGTIASARPAAAAAPTPFSGAPSGTPPGSRGRACSRYGIRIGNFPNFDIILDRFPLCFSALCLPAPCQYLRIFQTQCQCPSIGAAIRCRVFTLTLTYSLTYITPTGSHPPPTYPPTYPPTCNPMHDVRPQAAARVQ